MVTIKDLEAFFGDGWNRHDVDVLMTFMSDDCVFESTAGPEVCGTRYTGRERVGEAFARVFKIFPDAKFGDAHHFVAGNRGVSEWILLGHDGRWRKGRGQRLRHLHVPERQDRRQELVLQEPHRVNPPALASADQSSPLTGQPSASPAPPPRARR